MSGTIDNATSWGSTGESPADILNEAVGLISTTTINGVSFGVVLTLYIICVHSLIQEFRASIRPKQSLFSGMFITIMFVMGGVYCAVNSRLAQLEFVNFQNYPGGPSAYSNYLFSTPLNIWGATAFFLTTWMNDALLLWRLSVLYRGSYYATAINVSAMIMYLATFAMGMVTFVESVAPNETLWSKINIPFAMAYYILTVAYTIVITALMAARILIQRRRFIRATGKEGYGSQYLSIVSMIIESSALYTVWGIIFLVLYILNNPLQTLFLSSLSEVQIIAPLLITYRVSAGKGWEYNTSQTLSQGNSENSREKGFGAAINFKTTVHSDFPGSTAVGSVSASVDKLQIRQYVIVSNCTSCTFVFRIFIFYTVYPFALLYLLTSCEFISKANYARMPC